MWLPVSILILCTVYSAYSQSVRIEPFRSVFALVEGSTLEVKCLSSSSVTWSSDDSTAIPDGAVEARVGTGSTISTLRLVNVTKYNAGTYFCTGAQNNRVSFSLEVYEVTTESATFEYKKDTTLKCHVDEAGMTFTYSWRKGETPVQDIPVEGKQGFVVHENGTLEIIHPARRFAGLYTCTAEYQLGKETLRLEMDVPYYASPKVLPFDKSKNLVQEEKLVVECQVLGYPKPTITWKKGDKLITVDKESRIQLSSANTYDGKPIDNGHLEIVSVDFDDAGEYICIAEESRWSNFTSSQPILVRVKDKLAALWPFLCIVGEVVILCIIIFVYEKKRNKDAMLDEDEDQDGTTPEKKSDSVRHRGNTNNPRA